MRVLSYNIRHGQGVGGVPSTPRVARLVIRSGCDVAALAEVWRGDRFDQAAALARLTGRSSAYDPVMPVMGGRVAEGNLILTRCPPRAVRSIDLGRGRGCLLVECGDDDQRFVFGATHLSLARKVRRLQLEQLAEELPRDLPLVIAGDFNCAARELAPLAALLAFPDPVPRTFPSISPMMSLDHIGFSRHWKLESIAALPSLASDHLPLLAEVTRIA